MAITGTREVDPISRIEGHLGVKLTVDAGVVTEADVHGNLWRGFENFLIGRQPNDAITFTQRICGVCPVPHGTTATHAVEAALGYNDNFHTGMIGAPGVGAGKGIPEKALHIRNLVLSSEFLMSSLTHFYHLAAPSYVQGPNIPPWTPYFNDNFYHTLLRSNGKGTGNLTGAGTGGTLPADDATNGFSKDLWSAVIKQYVKALRIRRLTFEAGALFAGRMPMTSALVAGGVAYDGSASLTARCTQFKELTKEIGDFIIKEYVPITLALGYLYNDYDNTHNGGQGYGAGVGNFLAWGGFPQTDGTLALTKGYMVGESDFPAHAITSADVLTHLREHIKFSRYTRSQANDKGGNPLATDITDPASEDRTKPVRNVPAKYSWLKAPRWNGNAMEVGPMARMFVMGVIKENVAYATSADLSGMGLAGYADYVKAIPAAAGVGGGGLDPKMIGADLAVACLREGLATLQISTGGGNYTVVGLGAKPATGPLSAANVTWLNIIGLANATILSAYTDGLGAAAIFDGPADITASTPGLISYIAGLTGGLSTMDRLRGRSIESLYLVQKMIGAYNKATGAWSSTSWVDDLSSATGGTYSHKVVPTSGFGFGAAEAPRGALMHMVTIENRKIAKYQCIVPTTWNGSPKGAGTAPDRGPIEQAMIGIPYANYTQTFTNAAGGTSAATEGGVEALRIAQSFDPCIACAVH